MNKYVYLGTSVNLNHRGFDKESLYEITMHKDCFYVKQEIEARMDFKYLKHFKPLNELVERAIPTAEEIIRELNGLFTHKDWICNKEKNSFYSHKNGLRIGMYKGKLTNLHFISLSVSHKITTFFMNRSEE